MIYIQLNLNHVPHTQWERAEPCPLFVPLSSYSDKHVESDGTKGSVVLPCIVISLCWASSSPLNIITQFSPKFPRPLPASIHSIIFTNPFMSTGSPSFLPFHSLNPQRFQSSIHSLPHNLQSFRTSIQSDILLARSCPLSCLLLYPPFHSLNPQRLQSSIQSSLLYIHFLSIHPFTPTASSPPPPFFFSSALSPLPPPLIL